MDAVTARLGAHVHHRIAGALGASLEDPARLGDAEGKGVDQDVRVVRVVEEYLAADGRHADAVAVAADAGDDAGEEIARARMLEGAEAKRVERSDRPRPHRENIAEDAAYARGRSLIRFDKRGMVVALHFEDSREAVSDIHDAGVFSGALYDRLA